jgi:hypothetical protein
MTSPGQTISDDIARALLRLLEVKPGATLKQVAAALLLAREALEAVEGDWSARVTCYWCGFEPAPEGQRPPFEPGGQHRPDCLRERALAAVLEVGE